MTRFLLSLLLIFVAHHSFAAQTVSGRIVRVGSLIYLSTSSITVASADTTLEQLYQLSTLNPETQQTLTRLAQGDTIIATAEVHPSNTLMVLDSIDFVGLTRMIGLWSTPNSKGLMNFASYSDLNVYALILQANGSGAITSRKNFKYTLTPGQDKEWVMFLSDEKETQMSFLDVQDQRAVIRLLNSQTGEITRTIRLQKVSR